MEQEMKATNSNEESEFLEEIDGFVNSRTRIPYYKWYTKITLKTKDFSITAGCLMDSGAGLNCIREVLIPTRYFEKTHYSAGIANGKRMNIRYKFPNSHACKKGICIKTIYGC